MVVLDASFRDVAQRSLRDLAGCADRRAHRSRRAAARRQLRAAGAIAGLETRLVDAGLRPLRTDSIDASRATCPGARPRPPARSSISVRRSRRVRKRYFAVAGPANGARDREPRHLFRRRIPRPKRNLTFSVASSLEPLRRAALALRAASCSAGFFVLDAGAARHASASLLRWVLSPVRRLEKEINAVRRGHARVAGRRLSARAEWCGHQSQHAAHW